MRVYRLATISISNRQCCKPFSRGTMLVLVWSALLSAAQRFSYTSLHLALPSDLQFGYDCAYYALWVLLPVTGWAAESWLGRYRAITAGFFLSMSAALVGVAAFIMLQFSWTPIPAFTTSCIALLIGTVGFGMFLTSVLPFMLDQMLGASGEELSAAIQWYYWGQCAAELLKDILQCIPILNTIFLHILPTIFITIGILFLSAILISDCLYHSWLDTTSKITNPIKLIYKVLNYARKTKYPTNRSAFTYLDEEQPSRIDFGKDKFGGPFTEEEVEDVKTVIRMLPLLIVAGVYLSQKANETFSTHMIPTTKQTHICVADVYEVIYIITTLLLIPAYRFILYPVFYNYTPSMMKRVGAGLFLCLISTLINLTLDTVGHLHNNTTHCVFDTNTGSTETLTIPLYWLLILNVVCGLGFGLVVCTSLEFIMAQTPNRMRGVMMGLVFTTVGLFTLLCQLLKILFRYFNTATPSCGFYYYLVLSLLTLLILVLFIMLAKHYKLRERERHVNIQAIAEEHYERYLDQEEEYMKEIANRY